MGSNLNDMVVSIAAAPDGSTYFGGYFHGGTFNFGNIGQSPMTVNNSYAYNGAWGTTADAFVAKWSATARSAVWIKTFGNTGGNETVNGMVVDSSGFIYTVGSFTSLGVAGLGLSNAQYPYADILVSKFGSGNTLSWAFRFGGIDHDEGYGIALSPAQDAVYITGYFTGNVSFGSTNLTGIGAEAFVAKLATSNGAVQWAIGLGGAGTEVGFSVATDLSTAVQQQGSVIVVGYTNSASFVAGSNTFATNGAEDGWILRVSPTGNVTWGNIVGGTSSDVPTMGLAVHNATGDIYVSGSLNSSWLTFAGSTVAKTGGGSSIVVAKFAANGTQLWMQVFSGTGSDACLSLAMNMAKGIIYVGATKGSPTLTFNGTVITSRLFVFSLDTSGTPITAAQINGASTNLPYNVVRATFVDQYNGKVWIAGGFDDADTVSYNNLVFNEYGQQDAWIALFDGGLVPMNY